MYMPGVFLYFLDASTCPQNTICTKTTRDTYRMSTAGYQQKAPKGWEITWETYAVCVLAHLSRVIPLSKWGVSSCLCRLAHVQVGSHHKMLVTHTGCRYLQQVPSTITLPPGIAQSNHPSCRSDDKAGDEQRIYCLVAFVVQTYGLSFCLSTSWHAV